MDLNWLEDFLALAEAANFSRAADKRKITQPAFSRRIRALEEWMGAPLFSRERHKVTLTNAGAKIHPEIEVLVRSVYRMQETTRQSAPHKPATLHFAATHSLSLGFFPNWIKKFAQPTDGYAINLISDTMAACEEAMLQERVQFLLCHETPILPSRFAVKGYPSFVVGSDVLAPYTATDKRGKGLWRLDSLPSGHVPWLQYSPESAFHRMMKEHTAIQAKISPTTPSFTARFASVLLCVACDGEGIAWLPASLAEHATAVGHLTPAGGREWNIPLDICLFRSGNDISESTMLLWKAVASSSGCMRTGAKE